MAWPHSSYTSREWCLLAKNAQDAPRAEKDGMQPLSYLLQAPTHTIVVVIVVIIVFITEFAEGDVEKGWGGDLSGAGQGKFAQGSTGRKRGRVTGQEIGEGRGKERAKGGTVEGGRG